MENDLIQIQLCKYIQYKFGEYILVIPYINGNIAMNQSIGLEGTSAFAWKCLTENCSFEFMMNEMREKYDVDENTLKNDLIDLLYQLQKANILILKK